VGKRIKKSSQAGIVTFDRFGCLDYVDYYGEKRKVQMYVVDTKVCMKPVDEAEPSFSLEGKLITGVQVPVLKEGK